MENNRLFLNLTNQMANYYLVNTSKTVYNNRAYSFAKGETVTERYMLRSGANPTGWTILLTDAEYKIRVANEEVDRVNKEKITFTNDQLEKIAFITDLMMNFYGKARSEFCFGVGPSQMAPNVDKDTFWFGVKLTDLGGRLLNKSGRPVALNLKTCNFVAVSTLLKRFENNLPLFAHEA